MSNTPEAPIIIGNGNKAWELLIDMIRSVKSDVVGLRSELSGDIEAVASDVKEIYRELQPYTSRMDSLHCQEHIDKIIGLEENQRYLISKLSNKLSWKALGVAALTAVTAGIAIGMRV